MKLFAVTCFASAFSETNIENQIERFRRDAGYETIPFLESKMEEPRQFFTKRVCQLENLTGILEEARAWPASQNAEYRQNGKVITIDDLDMYVVGEGNKNGKLYFNLQGPSN